MPSDRSGSELAVPAKNTKSSIIEFSTEEQPDLNEGLTFGDTPVHCTCPHCERSVITFIDHETSWVTWVLGFVVWFSLGWMAFWVLPLLWPAFKDVVHHCPRCLNVIARKSRISLPTFKTEVMTCKIGSCAVVLARKYVMICAGLILLIVATYVLRSTVHLYPQQEVEKGPASLLTWEDFLFDCGPRTTLQHRASTSRSFEDRYRKRTFKWQGEVRHIREGIDVWFFHTKSVVMLRMYPSRYPRRDLPDIALLFGENLNVEVADLNPGDWVEFEATMAAHGHRGDPEVLMLWHVKVVPKPSPLTSSPGGQRAIKDFDKEEAEMKRTKKEKTAKHTEIKKAAEDVAASKPDAKGSEADAKVEKPPQVDGKGSETDVKSEKAADVLAASAEAATSKVDEAGAAKAKGSNETV